MTSWAIASRRSSSINVLRVSHDVRLVMMRMLNRVDEQNRADWRGDGDETRASGNSDGRCHCFCLKIKNNENMNIFMHLFVVHEEISTLRQYRLLLALWREQYSQSNARDIVINESVP